MALLTAKPFCCKANPALLYLKKIRRFDTCGLYLHTFLQSETEPARKFVKDNPACQTQRHNDVFADLIRLCQFDFIDTGCFPRLNQPDILLCVRRIFTAHFAVI